MKIQNHLFNLYLTFVVLVGAAVLVTAGLYLPTTTKLDFGLLFIAVFSVTLASKFSIEIPGSKVYLTMSDTLVFLTLLFYGGAAAVIIAFADAFAATLGYYRAGVYTRSSTILQNSGTMALATGVTILTLEIFTKFFSQSSSHHNWQNFVTMLGLMAVAQFFSSSIIVAVGIALRQEKNVFVVWREKCLASSLGYIAAAGFAGLLYAMVENLNIGLVIVAGLVSIILYFTYRNILSEIKMRREQAEIAEQARIAAIEQQAEVERCRALEAEAHILELSSHIEEQERTRTELARYITEQELIGEALRQSKEDFKHAALHDGLTGLPNRVALFNKIEQMLLNQTDFQAAEIHRSVGGSVLSFAVLFMDLDGFKKVNDSLGHSFGDELLKKVAERLRHVVRRDGDLLARLGGDEFAIVLEELISEKDAIAFAARVREAVITPFNINGTQILTGTSIGVVICREDYQKPEEILRDADLAMYHAKENRSGVAVFNPELRFKAIKNIEIENDLRRAIDCNELLLHYQPLVSLEDNSLIGFEALIRWQHPERGFLPPLEFIPIAENTGLIVPVTLWVLRESCLQLSRWHWGWAANRNLYVSVNLSSRHLTHPTLVEDVTAILRETGLPAQYLRLELTESAVMENAEKAAEVLHSLREMGIQLSIDDFGTGYSSLSLLHSFPFDTIKIDRSFVSRMSETGENTEIVETIIALAKSLKMEVLAEGVETSWQANLLCKLGCQRAQGFLYSRPLPPTEIEAAMKSKQSWLTPENSTENNNSLLLAVNSPNLTFFDNPTAQIQKGKLLPLNRRKSSRLKSSE